VPIAFAAGALPRTPLEELTALPRSLAGCRRGKDGEEKRKGSRREGTGGKEKGREGREGVVQLNSLKETFPLLFGLLLLQSEHSCLIVFI